MKKIIIENYANSQIYGILIINEADVNNYTGDGKCKATLIYLQQYELITDNDMEHEGTREVVNNLVKKAEEVCNENNWILYSY